MLVVLGLLYLFLVGISLLEGGIGELGSDIQQRLFDSVSNPLAGVFVGTLATVVVQSSSVTTSVIVGMVGAGVIDVDAAVPMIMGANIGTTVTNTLASLTTIRRLDEFRRSFAAATVHDFFNVLSVAVLLPLELATGFLSSAAEWLSERLVGQSGADWESPVKKIVKEPVGWAKDALEGLGASETLLGVLMIVLGLVVIFVTLLYITRNMKVLVAERLEYSVNKVLGRGAGLVAMGVGLVVTISVQSSSITTSLMIPLAAAGVVTLENIYPVTLGANLGTTVTALLAALAASTPGALTVALTHTLFNLFGIALFYPVRVLREIPMRLARLLADLACRNRLLAMGYVVGAFIVLPLVGIIVLS